MTLETRQQFRDIVLRGTREDRGMAGFADVLKPADADLLYRYVSLRAYEDYGDQ